jgi:hypothetical protein
MSLDSAVTEFGSSLASITSRLMRQRPSTTPKRTRAATSFQDISKQAIPKKEHDIISQLTS